MSWNPPKLQVKSIKIHSNSKKKKQKNKQKKKRTLKEKKKENLGKQTNKKQTETVLPGFLT